MQGQVMTVLGPVSADDLGPTVAHEHLLIDLSCYWQRPEDPDRAVLAEAPFEMSMIGIVKRDPFFSLDNNVLDDIALAIEEANEFKNLGGGTIVDVTPPDVGRDPLALQTIARSTGLNIVAGTAHYIHLAHPPGLEDEPTDEIAQRMITELTEGMEGTGIRAGVIGEIGTSHPLHPREERVLRAAARAQQATGYPISVHVAPSARRGHDVLDILENEGTDLGRVVMGHLDLTLGHLDAEFDEIVGYHSSLADRGCYIQYDTCGVELYVPSGGLGPPFWLPSDLTRLRAIARLLEAGHGDRLLLSQDVCTKKDLVHYGGFGYGHILRNFVHNLEEIGTSRTEIDRLLIGNPKRMLARQHYQSG